MFFVCISLLVVSFPFFYRFGDRGTPLDLNNTPSLSITASNKICSADPMVHDGDANLVEVDSSRRLAVPWKTRLVLRFSGRWFYA